MQPTLKFVTVLKVCDCLILPSNPNGEANTGGLPDQKPIKRKFNIRTAHTIRRVYDMDVDEERKLIQLRKLIRRISRCLKCYVKFEDYSMEDRIRIREWYNNGPWFFPPSKDIKVKGFFGTGDVMFVCQRPSTRSFVCEDGRPEFEFYKLMGSHEFGDAHITDLVKCRKKAGKLGKKEIDNCLPFLKKEIEILKPMLIIAVGEEVYKILTERQDEILPKGQDVPIIKKVTHYSYRFDDTKFRQLDKEFVEIKGEYKKLKRIATFERQLA